MTFSEHAPTSVLISSILYNPGVTNEAYIRHRIEMVKADTSLSKGERHKQIERWCDILDMHKAEAEKYGEVYEDE